MQAEGCAFAEALAVATNAAGQLRSDSARQRPTR